MSTPSASQPEPQEALPSPPATVSLRVRNFTGAEHVVTLDPTKTKTVHDLSAISGTILAPFFGPDGPLFPPASLLRWLMVEDAEDAESCGVGEDEDAEGEIEEDCSMLSEHEDAVSVFGPASDGTGEEEALPGQASGDGGTKDNEHSSSSAADAFLSPDTALNFENSHIVYQFVIVSSGLTLEEDGDGSREWIDWRKRVRQLIKDLNTVEKARTFIYDRVYLQDPEKERRSALGGNCFPCLLGGCYLVTSGFTDLCRAIVELPPSEWKKHEEQSGGQLFPVSQRQSFCLEVALGVLEWDRLDEAEGRCFELAKQALQLEAEEIIPAVVADFLGKCFKIGSSSWLAPKYRECMQVLLGCVARKDGLAQLFEELEKRHFFQNFFWEKSAWILSSTGKKGKGKIEDVAECSHCHKGRNAVLIGEVLPFSERWSALRLFADENIGLLRKYFSCLEEVIKSLENKTMAGTTTDRSLTATSRTCSKLAGLTVDEAISLFLSNYPHTSAPCQQRGNPSEGGSSGEGTGPETLVQGYAHAYELYGKCEISETADMEIFLSRGEPPGFGELMNCKDYDRVTYVELEPRETYGRNIYTFHSSKGKKLHSVSVCGETFAKMYHSYRDRKGKGKAKDSDSGAAIFAKGGLNEYKYDNKGENNLNEGDIFFGAKEKVIIWCHACCVCTEHDGFGKGTKGKH
ncbi:unnamed protein product [Amoebophrya sp. A120]|nr:unnamed protein product [Amoebophrya sp. A120]|eukprot:GSA120T00000131001.1